MPKIRTTLALNNGETLVVTEEISLDLDWYAKRQYASLSGADAVLVFSFGVTVEGALAPRDPENVSETRVIVPVSSVVVAIVEQLLDN